MPFTSIVRRGQKGFIEKGMEWLAMLTFLMLSKSQLCLMLRTAIVN